MAETDREAAIAAEKWRKQQVWEEARLEIARGELAKKPSKWLPTISLASTVTVALIATAVTSHNLSSSRLEVLQDEQRKSIQANVTEYLGVMLNALTAAQEISANAVVNNVEPTPEQWAIYDREQRKLLSALHLAGAKVFMESREVSAALEKNYAEFRAWDERLIGMRSKNSGSQDRRALWEKINNGLLEIKLIPTLEKLRPVLRRPGIEAAALP